MITRITLRILFSFIIPFMICAIGIYHAVGEFSEYISSWRQRMREEIQTIGVIWKNPE